MRAPRSNTLLIRTPEGILFSQLLAGPMSRFFAWLIDLACIMTASSILGSITGVLGIISIDFARALTVLLYFWISICYGIAAELGWRGQTIGKRLLRLQIGRASCRERV